VIIRNRQRFPEHRFITGLLPDVDVDARLSLCFDVLIHQPTVEIFDAVLDSVVSRSHYGLINGFDHAPALTSDIVFWHRPLGESLARRGLNLNP
jgi:hypothetical protein